MISSWDHPSQTIPIIVGEVFGALGMTWFMMWLGYYILFWIYGAILNWQARRWLDKNSAEISVKDLWEKDRYFNKNLRL